MPLHGPACRRGGEGLQGAHAWARAHARARACLRRRPFAACGTALQVWWRRWGCPPAKPMMGTCQVVPLSRRRGAAAGGGGGGQRRRQLWPRRREQQQVSGRLRRCLSEHGGGMMPGSCVENRAVLSPSPPAAGAVGAAAGSGEAGAGAGESPRLRRALFVKPEGRRVKTEGVSGVVDLTVRGRWGDAGRGLSVERPGAGAVGLGAGGGGRRGCRSARALCRVRRRPWSWAGGGWRATRLRCATWRTVMTRQPASGRW